MNDLSSDIAGGRRGGSLAANVLILIAIMAVWGSSSRLIAQTANFSASRTAVCPGSYINYTNLSTHPGGAPMTYAWTFPGGFPNADTSRNPLVYYATPGLYSVSLTVCSGGVCDTETRNALIRVHTPPTAAYTWSVPDVCDPLSIQFNDATAAGSSALTSWFWDFDNGTGSGAASPLQSFATPSTYEVILLVTDANGCQTSTTQNVTPQIPLQASAAITNAATCGAGPLTASLSASASGGTGPYLYSWDFGNGDTGAGAVVAPVYNGCGMYDVEVVASDANGCRDTVRYADAVRLFCPTVAFNLSADTVCMGQPVVATDASTPTGGTHTWQFDALDPSSTATGLAVGYTYDAPGVYEIEHCVTYPNGCQECVTREVVVRNKPLGGSIQIDQLTTCRVPFTTTIQAVGATGTPPLTYNWTILSASFSGEVINPVFPSPGIYPVSLVVTDAVGCTDTLIHPTPIRIRAAIPDFTLSSMEGCAPLTVDFTNTSVSPLIPIDSFSWSLGDGTTFTSTSLDSFQHVYGAVGTYEVSLVTHTPLGCTDTAYATIQVGEVVAEFELVRDTTCATAQLVNLSSNADYTIVYWGNGDSTVLPDPMGNFDYFYFGITEPTLYTITMVAYFNGCSDTVSHPILVNPPIVLDRTITRDCNNPLAVTLWIDPSYLLGDFCWDLGSGDTLCNQNPVNIIFPSEGVYTVYIRDEDNPIYDTACVVDYIEVSVVVSAASFVADDLSGCETLTTHFSNSNSDPVFDGVTYRWIVGPSEVNGFTDTAIVVGDTWTYTFPAPDIYPVRMTALDTTVCNLSYSATAIVSDPTPVVIVDSITGCSPATVFLRDSSYAAFDDPRVAINNWAWEFGTASCPPFSGQFPPSCSYNPGSYTVRLRARDANGCSALINVPLGITAPDVEALFYVEPPVCGNDTAYFINQSAGTGLASYFWDFGDGNTSTEANPAHVYASSGTYAVRLTVTDSLGCSDPLTRMVAIALGDVVPDFTITYFSAGICPPIPVELSNTSSGSVVNTEWYVETATGTNYYTGDAAIHTYTRAGDYDITMVVTDSRGCTDTLTRTDNVTITGPTGELVLTPNEGCAPLEVFFDLENIRADQVFIDFGNGDTLQVFGDFYFTYDEPGSYCPRMILLDSLGCETSYNCPSPITVFDVPRAELGLSEPLICDGNQLWVYNLSPLDSLISPVVRTILDFGDGTVLDMAGSFDSLAHFYPISGIYTVRLLLENAGGCTDSAEAVVAVGEIPTGSYSIAPAAGCGDVTVRIDLGGVFADSAFVDFGNGVTLYASSDSLEYTYTVPGMYTPQLILRNSTGCSAVIANGDPVTVAYAPLADLQVTDRSNCDGESFLLVNASTDTVSNPLLNAIDHMELSVEGVVLASGSSVGSVPYTPFAPGTYVATLVVSNQWGCADTAALTLTTHPLPIAAYALDNAIGCAPVSAGVSFFSLLADSAMIDFGDGTALYSDTGAVHTYTVPGVYYPRVILRDTTGCQSIIANGDPVTVGYAPEAVLYIPDQSLCEGSAFSLINQSVDTVANPLINPIDDLAMWVNGSLVASGPPINTILHTPVATGVYEVLLVASSDLGCTDTARATVESVPVPSGDYALLDATGCAPLTATIELIGLDADTAWLSLGDGTVLEVTGTVTHTYLEAGIYTPQLVLNDATGCSSVVANGDPVTVGYAPEAVLYIPDQSLCEGSAFSLINQSVDTVANPLINPIDDLAMWVNGSLVASGPPINTILHTPVATGVYEVLLVASSDLGCTDTARATVESVPVPSGDYALLDATGCAPLTATIELIGLDADTAWLSLGDGTVLEVTGTVTHTYLEAGIYTPQLVLNDATGCSSVVANGDPVTVGPAPVAALAIPDQSLCEGLSFSLINETRDTTAAGFQAVEDLALYVDGVLVASGPPMNTVLFNPALSGTFEVMLVASNSLGCSDTVRSSITQHPTPQGNYSLAAASGCAPLNTWIELSGLDTDSAWVDMGDGNVLHASESFAYTYRVPGFYQPSLLLRDASGCENLVISGEEIMVAHSPVARLGLSDSSQCARQTLELVNLSVDTVSDTRINAIDELRLFFDGVLIASGPRLDTVRYEANNPGDFWVDLVALNDLGCVDTAQRTVVVHPVPLADAQADLRVCVGAPASLDGSGSLGANSWSWSPAGLVSDPDAAQTTAVLSEEQTFLLSVSNGFCQDIDSVRVSMIESLGLVPGPDEAICVGGSVPLSALVDGSAPGITWSWSPAGELSDPLSLNPIASPTGDAAYTITATCGILEESGTVFVDILESPQVEAQADTTLMILGSTVGLRAEGWGGTGELEYWWEQHPALSCTDCSNPQASPTEDTWFVVHVTDEEGCTELDSIFLRVFTDCLGSDFMIGKAFTPNGDGANDQFAFRSETIAELEAFRVWNRWGEIVFETRQLDEFWDGTLRGQPLDPAVFVYTLQGICLNGEPFLRTGDVTLIR